MKTRESIGRIILGNREQVQELYKLIVATRNLRWVIVAASSESMIPQQFLSSFKVSANRFSYSDERVFSAAIVKAYRQYFGSDWKIGRVEVNATQAPHVKSLLFHHLDAPHAGVFTQYDCTLGGVFWLNHDDQPLSVGADWGVQVTLKNDVVLPLRILRTVSIFEGGVHRLDLSRLVD